MSILALRKQQKKKRKEKFPIKEWEKAKKETKLLRSIRRQGIGRKGILQRMASKDCLVVRNFSGESTATEHETHTP